MNTDFPHLIETLDHITQKSEPEKVTTASEPVGGVNGTTENKMETGKNINLTIRAADEVSGDKLGIKVSDLPMEIEIEHPSKKINLNYKVVPPSRLTEIMIGKEAIYPQQQSLGAMVLEIFQRRRDGHLWARTPVICAQPQQGKTGAMIAVIDGYIQSCIDRGVRYQVIVLCGLSLKALQKQTKLRLTSARSRNGKGITGAQLGSKAVNSELIDYYSDEDDVECDGLNSGILILNNSIRLRTLKERCLPVVTERLILIDECHIGAGKNGCIDVLLKSLGVNISEQIHSWDDSHGQTFVCGISATPFAHIALSPQYDKNLDRALFEPVYLPPTAEYNSIRTMLDNGRLVEGGSLFTGKGESTLRWEAAIDRFMVDCHSDGPGYLVVRAMGKMHSRLTGWIGQRNRLGDPIDFQKFDSVDGNSRKCAKLVAFLGKAPKVPTIVIIRATMRAGMTPTAWPTRPPNNGTIGRTLRSRPSLKSCSAKSHETTRSSNEHQGPDEYGPG